MPEKPPIVLKVEALCELSIDLLDFYTQLMTPSLDEEQASVLEMYVLDWEKRLGVTRESVAEDA